MVAICFPQPICVPFLFCSCPKFNILIKIEKWAKSPVFLDFPAHQWYPVYVMDLHWRAEAPAHLFAVDVLFFICCSMHLTKDPAPLLYVSDSTSNHIAYCYSRQSCRYVFCIPDQRHTACTLPGYPYRPDAPGSDDNCCCPPQKSIDPFPSLVIFDLRGSTSPLTRSYKSTLSAPRK